MYVSDYFTFTDMANKLASSMYVSDYFTFIDD